MSIEDLISSAVRDGRLFPLLPRAAGDAPRRAMFLSENLWKLLRTKHLDSDMEERLGTLQADLELFVTGQRIDPKYLFLLYPPRQGVWEIRSARPKPSIRVLGLFIARDVFFASNYELRENLGAWESREWKKVKRTARTRWGHLFLTYPPLITTNIHEVVSGAIDGKYFKE